MTENNLPEVTGDDTFGSVVPSEETQVIDPAPTAVFEPPAGLPLGDAPSTPPNYGPLPDFSAYDAPAPVATKPKQKRPISKTPRISTIVWGLIVMLVGAGVVAITAGATIDWGLAMIWTLAGAGVVLIAASAISAARRNRQ